MEGKKVRAAMAYSGLSLTKAAKRLGMTYQNLQKKIARSTLTDEELRKLADTMGAQYVCKIVMPDGTEIG